MFIKKTWLYGGLAAIVAFSFWMGSFFSTKTIEIKDKYSVEQPSLVESLESTQTPLETQNTDIESHKNSSAPNFSAKPSGSNATIPHYVQTVLTHIRTYKKAPDGYVGGRVFQNREGLLPKEDHGQKIQYQEWDVHPKVNGQNRGAERLVTSDDKAYYTSDHYRSFTEIP